jgi:hypothetical protein
VFLRELHGLKTRATTVVARTDDDDDAFDATRERRTDPLPLEYFGAPEADRSDSRGATISIALLLLSWIPYLCGVVNAAAVAQSYVPAITIVHIRASVALLAVGLLLAILSLVRFLRARQYHGAIAAGAVVVVQAMLAGCLGLS